jgi:hypothetical protein
MNRSTTLEMGYFQLPKLKMYLVPRNHTDVHGFYLYGCEEVCGECMKRRDELSDFD